MKKKNDWEKMRVSFDLDEVLFVDPATHKTEPRLPFPFCKIFKERLRKGTPELIKRHLAEVQSHSSRILPQKVPSRYHISLHIDDESVICSYGKEYGFDAYQLDAEDDEWKEKVIARADEVKKKRELQKKMQTG